MGNIIKTYKQDDSSQIIKISSESITPRKTNKNNKMEISSINNIHHRKTIKESEDSTYLKSQKSQISNFYNIKKFIYQKQNILSETDKNNHIINTNNSSHLKYNNPINYKKNFTKNKYNYKSKEKLCTLVNANLYEFDFDSSSKSLSSRKFNSQNNDKIKNDNKIHSSVNAVKIPKKILTNRNLKIEMSPNKQMRSTDKTIFNDDDISISENLNENDKKSNKNKNFKEDKEQSEKTEKDNLDKKLNIDEILDDFQSKIKMNTDFNLETEIDVDLIKESSRKICKSNLPKKIIKPIKGFIYCPTVKNLLLPKNFDFSSPYSSNKTRKYQNLTNNMLKNNNSSDSNKSKNNICCNASPKSQILKFKNLSEVKKSSKKRLIDYKNNFYYKKSFPKKYSKHILNFDCTSSNDIINKEVKTPNNSNYFLNESQKRLKMRQLIGKISDNRLKNEILSLYQSPNSEHTKKSFKEDIKNNLNSSKNSEKYLIKYDTVNLRKSSRNMFSVNNMKVVSETHFNFYPKNSSNVLNYTYNEKYNNLNNRNCLISIKKRANSKNVYVNKIKSKSNYKNKYNINMINVHKNQENKLVIINMLLSNLIEEKIYYQSDIKKLINVKYFLINVNKAEYETEIKTHDILCLISDKYFTTLDKTINCNSPKKVIKIETIKKVNIIPIGSKRNIILKYVIIIIYCYYEKENQTIKEMQEGLLIEKKKDVDDMVSVLSKLIKDLEIIYL